MVVQFVTVRQMAVHAAAPFHSTAMVHSELLATIIQFIQMMVITLPGADKSIKYGSMDLVLTNYAVAS